MQTDHLYEASFPTAHKIQDTDLIRLYHEQRFDELDAVIVCRDKEGAVTASFGDSDWNCLPFSRKKSKNNLPFAEFERSPALQRELKLLTFGWLFNKNPKQRKATSFSSTKTRQASIKLAYRFLIQNCLSSLQALSKPSHWKSFEAYLINNGYAQSTIEQCFIAINKAIEFAPWHQLALGFTAPIKASVEAKKLCDLHKQQTLVIPERLCDEIYGKAIELIEEAHPFRALIAQTENAMQDNYLEGRRVLDEKIAQGAMFTFLKTDGGIDNHKFASALQENKPNSVLDIIAPLAEKLPNVKLSNGTDFKRYLGQLITSSYIVCGGFSGMRDSELDKLTPDSYYKDTFEGRDYHMLQSHTFKLGEKRETWVTAASSKTAIELMSTLTERWRSEVVYPNDKYTDSIWLNHTYRSKSPVLITDWSSRLQRFCRQFGMVVSEEDYQECLESNPRSLERIKESVTVGQPWPLTPHQFRRTLAFYCIKNRFSTLVALKQQFKHLYLAMTEWYTNGGKLASYRDLMVDEKVKNLLTEINAESTANKIFKQWHSDEKLAGTHGKAIMKMRGEIPSIYSSWEIIYRAVKDGKLTLHGSLHSYCKNGYNCDMDGVVMPQFCVDCGSGSSIIDEEQALWWQKKHNSLVAYMESDEDISVSERSHYITQVRAAEIVMADFELPFTPFEPDLKVANS
ncbi:MULTISPECIES: hypothetical protein [Gammaproteobacteria]|uniref:hypothetical protein n=1 Tax=Gammaproteobacteria TaxID=1236 RepID=UPI0013204646|nr:MULTISPECIES: hypothetical protein [Gammaproteobacteria]EKO3488273.1 hypothetical protein [Vibrio fluvialis]MCE9933845.1 hypothetical protein [Aeromonas salmonicida]QHD53112.1 hypothetical protein GM320_08025 [Shewanella algae]